MNHELPKLSFKLDHEGAIPLSDFTRALERTNSRYARFAKARAPNEDGRLYIADIREGSIIVDLVSNGLAAMAPIIPSLDSANTLWDFGNNLSDLLSYFAGNASRPKDLSTTDCDDAAAIVAPAAKTVGGGLSINANNITIGTLINISQSEAAAIENKALIEKNNLSKTHEKIEKDVLFVWHQVRDAPAIQEGRSSPDRGIIADISTKPLPVTFADPHAKEEMTINASHPFRTGFIVDVKVLTTINGPSGYRVLKLHDQQPLD